MKAPAIDKSGDLTPCRLQFSAGYMAIPLKGIATLKGAAFQVSAGQSFSLGRIRGKRLRPNKTPLPWEYDALAAEYFEDNYIRQDYLLT